MTTLNVFAKWKWSIWQLTVNYLSASNPSFIALTRDTEAVPWNIPPLPAGPMLGFVSRGCWRDARGGRGFSGWFWHGVTSSCFLTFTFLQGDREGREVQKASCRWSPRKFLWHPHGQFPSNCWKLVGNLLVTPLIIYCLSVKTCDSSVILLEG